MPNGTPPPKVSQKSPKKAPEIQQLQKDVISVVTGLNSRVKLVEERLESLRSHLNLLDQSLLSKHKTTLNEVRELEDSTRAMRGDMQKTKELSERVIQRLEAFASKDEVKVLQRYVDLWQPLNFVTRAEVKSLIEEALQKKKKK